jgi:hypothetical protein
MPNLIHDQAFKNIDSRPEYAQYICPLNIKQTAMVGLVGL